MPFEFTGAPPPPLETPSSFSSFECSAASGFTQTRHPPASPFSMTPMSFDLDSSPQLSSRQPAPKPSFGGSASSFFGPGQSRLQLNRPRSFPNNDGLDAVSLFAATDPLSKALVRSAKNRPSVWGRADIAGDQVVKDLIEGSVTCGVPAIVSGLQEVEKTHPVVVRFARLLFDAAVRARLPAVPPYTKTTSSPTTTAAEPVSSEQVADGGAASTQTSANTTAPSAPHFPPSSPEPHIKFPRNHPRIATFVATLAVRMLRGAVVTYPEAAKVLAAHITDLFYNGLSQSDVVAALITLRGMPDDIGEIADVASWADDGLDALETAYADEPPCNHEDGVEQDAEGQEEAPEEDVADGEVEDDASSEAGCASMSPASAFKSFRFLELPAEMRNIIYRLLLATDGHIGLMRIQYAYTADRRRHKDVIYPHTVLRNSCGANYYKLSECSPSILGVCQQIYEEAKQIMYEENTVCATVVLHTSTLVVSQRLLPDGLLSRLTSLMLVCDAADRSAFEATWFSQLPWKQLQFVTSLKSLRISIIEREYEKQTIDSKGWILEQILERIPAACQVTFESREGFEDSYVQEIIDESEAELNKRRSGAINDVYEVEGEVLEKLAKQYSNKQGRKSGHARDYRFPDRSISKVVGKLMPLSEVDPKLVLGGQFQG